jgi:hypothetical protein
MSDCSAVTVPAKPRATGRSSVVVGLVSGVADR